MWIKLGALAGFLLATANVAAHETGLPFAELSPKQQAFILKQIESDLCQTIVLGEDEELNTCEGVELNFKAEAERFRYVVGSEPLPIYYITEKHEFECVPVKDIIGIGNKRSEVLTAAGIGCVRELIAANPDKVSEVAGVSRARVDQWQQGAKVWLQKQEGLARE